MLMIPVQAIILLDPLLAFDINLEIFILCCWGFLSHLHTLHINGDGSFIFLIEYLIIPIF